MFSPKLASELANRPGLRPLYAEIVRPVVSLTLANWDFGQTSQAWLLYYDALTIAQEKGPVLVVTPNDMNGLVHVLRVHGFTGENMFFCEAFLDLTDADDVAAFIAAGQILSPVYILIDANFPEPWNVVCMSLRQIAKELDAAVDLVCTRRSFRQGVHLDGVSMVREFVNFDGNVNVRCLEYLHGPKFPDRICSLFPAASDERSLPVRAILRSTKKHRIKTRKNRSVKKQNLRLERMRQQELCWDDQKKAAMLDFFSYQCAYCGAYLGEDGRNMHADHYIPVTAANCPGTVPWNMVPACPECNLNKHAKQPDLWLAERFGADAAWAIKDTIERYFSEVQDA